VAGEIPPHVVEPIPLHFDNARLKYTMTEPAAKSGEISQKKRGEGGAGDATPARAWVSGKSGGNRMQVLCQMPPADRRGPFHRLQKKNKIYAFEALRVPGMNDE
jgi:hypothetical protein